MPSIRLTNPTGRNTQAHLVEIGLHSFYFSYETCIAYRGPRVCCRVANSYSRTTLKHMREMGVYDWPEVSSDAFHAVLEDYGDPITNWESSMIALVKLKEYHKAA